MSEAILGLSAYYHDSAAAVLVDGDIIAAAQEERFTRKKHDASFPANAVKYVLDEAGLACDELSHIAFYEKPLLKFERLLETYHAFAPNGLKSFLSAIPVWVKQKLFLKRILRKELVPWGIQHLPIYFPEHHLSHAASAFYPSPFRESAILTIDGVGEWATTTICHGHENNIKILNALHFPHSIGLLYSAFTHYTGFKVNGGEYKMMGLAPYGYMDSDQTHEFNEKIRTELVDIREDGSILLNMKYFRFATGLTMVHTLRWENLFGLPPRKEGTDIKQPYMNMAMAIQQVTEDIVLKLAKTAKELTQSNHLVMAGGVALNSVANGKLLSTGIYDDIWIQPAAGDAGGAVGAAYAIWHIQKGRDRETDDHSDAMKGTYLGPSYSDSAVKKIITKYHADYQYYEDVNELVTITANRLSNRNVVGWFQGRMEYGPRALGNRSILGDPRNLEMQKRMNLKIKFREDFRPFAPSVLEEDIQKYFTSPGPSSYMLFVVPINEQRRYHPSENHEQLSMYQRLYHSRSDIPAVTHVDYSARIQSVDRKSNPRFWKLLNEFKNQTGTSVLINTSFNIRGEPIVCTPDDAFRCFMKTDMDCMVIGNFLFDKAAQDDSTRRLALSPPPLYSRK